MSYDPGKLSIATDKHIQGVYVVFMYSAITVINPKIRIKRVLAFFKIGKPRTEIMNVKVSVLSNCHQYNYRRALNIVYKIQFMCTCNNVISDKPETHIFMFLLYSDSSGELALNIPSK